MTTRTRSNTPRGGPVVLLTELYPPAIGGSAVLFHEIYRRLESVPVLVVTDPRPREAEVAGPHLIEHAVGTPDWGVVRPRALSHHLRTRRVLRRLASRRTGVIHTGRALPEGIAAWSGRPFGGPRYVCWAHGEDLAMAYSSRELLLLTKAIYRGADCSLANSRHTASMLERLGVESERIALVHPGVDSEKFSPSVDGWQFRMRFAPAGELLILSVGRLQRRKGHDTAILAIAALQTTLPRLQYVIAGDGEERQRLERLAAEQGVGSRVHFVGAVSAEELTRLYAACDIFLLPNRIDQGDLEGFGIVFLEAASSGKVAIGGNSGGVPEAVDDGQTGFLVSGTDVRELSELLLRLAGDSRLRQCMGTAARQRVLKSFTWERAARTVADVHQRVLAGHELH